MFVYDLPINDAQHRLLVTTGVTQRRLGRELGIDLTTRGRYYSNPTDAAAAVGVSNPNDQPLFLHLEARTVEIMNRAREILERAVHFGELPWSSHGQSSTADGSGGGGGGGERRSRYGQQQQQQQQHQWTPRSRFGPDAVSERFPIDINPNHPRFNLRSKLLGPRGEYIKHIQDHCGVQLILRGLSQNEPPPTSSDQIYMECNAPSQQSLEQARELFNSLLQTIRTQFNEINR
ncbi:hypothetical protein GQ42DRAFT_129402 [Ramicandelaber brevisporus]|nr:hypothetical protein GQ42DRAFT_129402 [Ramicandelaber brevisporus]